jgi:hypothetical protein
MSSGVSSLIALSPSLSTKVLASDGVSWANEGAPVKARKNARPTATIKPLRLSMFIIFAVPFIF